MATKRRVRCSTCKKLYPKKDCYTGPDPYAEDMQGKKIKVTLCPTCYKAHIGDI